MNWKILISLNIFEFYLRIWVKFNQIKIQFKLHCNVVHISISFRNALVFLILRTFKENSSQIYLSFPYFFNIFSLSANKEDILHVSHCIMLSLLFDWNSFIYKLFNMSCHWHMNMCCLINLHMNMFTLFKRLQKVRMEICFWDIACGNNHDGAISINLVLNLLFIYK